MTNEPKINGTTAAGEAPQTGGRGVQRRGTKGDPYAEEIEFSLTSVVIRECLAFGPLVGCVSSK